MTDFQDSNEMSLADKVTGVVEWAIVVSAVGSVVFLALTSFFLGSL